MSVKINIDKLTVSYLFRNQEVNTIRSMVGRFIKKNYEHMSTDSNIIALDNICLSFSEGDRVGFLGANGSGKSTLLKVIAKIISPTNGVITVDGKVSSIFDPGLGMDAEASGFENIRIRCMILGVKKDKIKERIAEVAEFSGLAQALLRPIKTYSAGMLMKLSFSIATAIEPEILVMDEWLSAGDARFVSKALKKMQDLINASRILVIASHSEAVLTEWCNRLIWLHNGSVMADGNPKKVLSQYKIYTN